MSAMDINIAAIDDAVLALLYLTVHDRDRAWKSFDWDALNRLYERGLIGDPVNRAPRRSVKFLRIWSLQTPPPGDRRLAA
jgi:Domain of unknown function (DUF6429)